MTRSHASLPASLACLLLGACTAAHPGPSEGSAHDAALPATMEAIPTASYAENHRPQFHFSPPAHWMNDPNGLVYFDGEYHLFYQHNPRASLWGPMHWGHAVSRDLMHWQNLPVAFAPDEDGEAWSGSIVVDESNSSGLGTNGIPPMVALYTAHNRAFQAAGKAQPEQQNLAYSLDRGRTWHKYAGNPVLPNPGDQKNFRDPKVAWHAASHQWVMTLAEGDHTAFYGSPDLKNWHSLSQFGQGLGAHGGVWECPDLFALIVPESGETKWVLLQSLNAGAPNGGSGAQYFVGDFDGTHFTPDSRFAADVRKQGAMWLDWGRDNYAVISWAGVPATDGRRIAIGWMANWDYARQVPTEQWRGAMTVPRTLTLHRLATGYRLFAAPVQELATLHGAPQTLPAHTIDGTLKLDIPPATVSQSDLQLHFDRPTGPVRFGLVFSNARGEELRVGYDGTTGRYFSDRRKAADPAFSPKFAPRIDTAPRTATHQPITLRLLMDAASMELFADSGQTVMTETIFPSERFDRVALFSEGGSVRFKGGTLYPMRGIWPAPSSSGGQDHD
ncbi:glycoside hydrolase family 32 protein [Gluconacetobacter asukensis]|uniref:Glycoside hydrolase family 32 protein n=1 Tax=Gluconacetobacter asukensis TaxID=1017181 RepID=A0A7W4IZF9_9PROT|nr:glycoside hydrolase family 32 protein [Gluconacetobacter asukensis]MBB2171832.1 glycoside hydrolase family 32 protein [Gluconacetobacter asukensis]